MIPADCSTPSSCLGALTVDSSIPLEAHWKPDGACLTTTSPLCHKHPPAVESAPCSTQTRQLEQALPETSPAIILQHAESPTHNQPETTPATASCLESQIHPSLTRVNTSDAPRSGYDQNQIRPTGTVQTPPHYANNITPATPALREPLLHFGPPTSYGNGKASQKRKLVQYSEDSPCMNKGLGFGKVDDCMKTPEFNPTIMNNSSLESSSTFPQSRVLAYETLDSDSYISPSVGQSSLHLDPRLPYNPIGM